MLLQKRTTIISLLLLMAIVITACGTATQAPVAGAAASSSSGGGITVIGQGQAAGEPDEANVQIGVEVFADTVSQATTENETSVQNIMEAMRNLGIAAEDVQTTNYNLWAEQIYGDRGPEGIAGYRVNNTVNVKIRDIDLVGDVLAAATEAGANSIHGFIFLCLTRLLWKLKRVRRLWLMHGHGLNLWLL